MRLARQRSQRAVRALPRQAGAEQRHELPDRRRLARRTRLAAGHRRRRPGSRRARARGARRPDATSRSPAGSTGRGDAAAGRRVDADLSVARTRVAQPRADRGERPRRANRRDGHRRHARHHRARTSRGCSRHRPTGSPTTCAGSRRRRPFAHASARRRDARSSATSTRPASRSRDRGVCIEELARRMKVALVARVGVSAARARRARAARLRPRPRARGSRRRRDAHHPAADTRRRRRRGGADSIHPRRRASSSCRTARSRSPDAAGTTVLDRSTAYPLFGLRAGRRGARSRPPAGRVDIVHGLGASVLGYARRGSAPLAGQARGGRQRRRWC